MNEQLSAFEQYLHEAEKSAATIEKYIRDVRGFLAFLAGQHISKAAVIAYKECLAAHYAPASVNSMLIAVNRFLRFCGWETCCVQLLKIQRQIFVREDKELTKAEYQQLVKAANGTQLSYVLQAISGTGIRVSELQYITVEAVRAGKAVVNCKNKLRIILIPASLQKLLTKYIKKSGIKAGSIFVTKNGKPLDRSNIWKAMKALCERAGVPTQKVYPHALRHLFARIFYSIDRDIIRLADLLGHSSINTTRIYTMETGYQYISQLERLQKILTA